MSSVNKESAEVVLQAMNENTDLLQSVQQYAHNNLPPKGRRPLEYSDPQVCLEILKRVANGESHNRICKDTGICRHTISQIADRHSVAVERQREVMQMGAQQLVHWSHEALARRLVSALNNDKELKQIPVKELAMAYNITTDRVLTLNGQPNQIIEERRGVTVDDMRKYHESLLKEAIPVQEVHNET